MKNIRFGQLFAARFDWYLRNYANVPSRTRENLNLMIARVARSFGREKLDKFNIQDTDFLAIFLHDLKKIIFICEPIPPNLEQTLHECMQDTYVSLIGKR